MPADPSDRPPGPPRVLGAGFAARPHPVLERLRRTCPVVMVRMPTGEDMWVVTRERDVRAGLTDPRLVTAV